MHFLECKIIVNTLHGHSAPISMSHTSLWDLQNWQSSAWWNMQESIEIFCIAEQQQIAEGIVLINTDYLHTQGNQ